MMSKKPMRILEGNAKPFEPFWRCVDAAASDSGEPEIEFYGYISEYSMFDDDITPARFKNDLMTLGRGGPVTVRIHSGGGDVFAASAIRAILMDYPGRVTTRIDGLAASAATYVAMAGDRVLMQDSAFFMIHDPSAIAMGTVDDLKSVIDLLKTIKSGIVETYQAKTQMDAERLAKMMSAETWMTAQEALEMGFVDEVISSRPVSPAFGGFRNVAIMNALDHFHNVPGELLARVMEEGTPAPEGTPTQDEPPTPTLEGDMANEPEEGGNSDAPEAVTDDEPESVRILTTDEAVQELKNYLDVFGPR